MLVCHNEKDKILAWLYRDGGKRSILGMLTPAHFPKGGNGVMNFRVSGHAGEIHTGLNLNKTRLLQS